MNGKKAKHIRRIAYTNKPGGKLYTDPNTGQVTASEPRQYYKHLKKSYLKGELSGI